YVNNIVAYCSVNKEQFDITKTCSGKAKLSRTQEENYNKGFLKMMEPIVKRFVYDKCGRDVRNSISKLAPSSNKFDNIVCKYANVIKNNCQ
ncbi:MAG: hypothetical protein IJ638_00760, partial [Alphaproteobacteria bacterium]|nr:hypothetical protein [Alphaproteobacteria bacterium]